MARLLFPRSTFAPIVGLEVPAIVNLGFATFLGNGVVNSRDATNIAPGAAPFTPIGAGPTYGQNFATVQAPNNAIQTPMLDGGDPASLVWAMRSPPSGFSAPLQFNGASPVFINHLWVSGVPTARCTGGLIGLGAGVCDIPMIPDSTTWQLLAVVWKIGKPVAGYNLTTGVTASSPTPVASTARPVAGAWTIGAAQGTYNNPSDVAFALGATSEISATDLNALAAALRFPLRDREIYV